MDPICGIDLGGTKIEGVILENKTSTNVLERMRIPTEKEKGYERILDNIERVIRMISATGPYAFDHIGIGTPGVLDPHSQTMKNCNATVLNDKPLKHDLEDKLQIEVRMANDANCFAIAEAKFGVVKEHFAHPETVFGVIMGTGVGGGIVVHGKLLAGYQGIAGEWGHTHLEHEGDLCYCGRRGCVETVISGPALERHYYRLTGQALTLPTIVKAHESGGDPAATETMLRLVQYFGRGIADVINILDPDAVVLGGGVGNIDLLYSEGVREVEKYVFNRQLDTLFLKPKLGDSAGVFGAALL